MATDPRRIQPVSRDLVERAKALVDGVEIDLNSVLADDDERDIQAEVRRLEPRKGD